MTELVTHGRDVQVAGVTSYHDVFSDRKATIVQVELSILGESFIGNGSAYRVAEDEYNERTGTLLATTRAVEDLLARLKYQARKIK